VDGSDLDRKALGGGAVETEVGTVVVEVTETGSSREARLSDPDEWVSQRLHTGGTVAGACDKGFRECEPCSSQVLDAQEAAGLRRDLEAAGFQRDFEVRASSEFCNPREGDFLLKAFPEKFPFGHGAYLDPARRRPFRGFAAYVEHLSRLSLGSFQDAEVQLFFNDQINAQRMARAAYVACTMAPTGAAGSGAAGPLFAKLKPADLRLAGEYMQKCASARRCGRRVPEPPVSDTLSSGFFKSLDRCVATSQTSAEACMRARRDVTALHQAFGTATWFITVAPNDRNSASLVCLSADDLRLHRTKLSDPATLERPVRSFMVKQLPWCVRAQL